MKKLILLCCLIYSANSFAQYSTYNANSHNQYNYNSGYTPPARPAYTAPSYYKPSYTPSYTKPSYNSNTPSYTPSTSTYTSKTYSSGNSDNTKTTPPTDTKATDATTTIPTTTPTPTATTTNIINYKVLAEQWLTKMLANPLTAEEERASLKIAYELIKLIESASNGFQGYKGKFIDFSDHHFKVINTDFLYSKNQYIWSHPNYDVQGFIAEFDDKEVSSYAKKIIYLAFLKQIPLLTAGKEEYKIGLEERGVSLAYTLAKANEVKHYGYDPTVNDIEINQDGSLRRLQITFDPPYRAPNKQEMLDKQEILAKATEAELLRKKEKVVSINMAKEFLIKISAVQLPKNENDVSINMAKEIMKIFISANNGFEGYKGNNNGNWYGCINTDFFFKSYRSDYINIGDANIGDRKTPRFSATFWVGPQGKGAPQEEIVIIYTSIIKQFPLLSTPLNKYTITVNEERTYGKQYSYNIQMNSKDVGLLEFEDNKFLYLKIYQINNSDNTKSTPPAAPYRAPNKSSTPTNSASTTSATSTPSNTNTSTINTTATKPANANSNVLAQQWLTNHVSGSVTAEENEESLKTAKELLKLIQSARNNFEGYKGKFKDSALGTLNYQVINTGFLHCNYQTLQDYKYLAYFSFKEANKKNIRNIYLAILKQVPLLSNETSFRLKVEIDEDASSYIYHLNDSSNNTNCNIIIGKEKETLALSIWGGSMK